MTTTIAKINKAYVRLYSDTGQVTAYVEWVDTEGNAGRTEGSLGAHMQALFERAKREGITPTSERW